MLFPKFARRRRKQLLYVLVAILVLGFGPYVVSRLRSAGRQIRLHVAAPQEVTTERVTTVRVLSFNIAHGRGATNDNWKGGADGKVQRLVDIAELIHDSTADVVVLNEVDFCSTWSGHQNQARAIALQAGFPFWVEQRNFDCRFIYGSWKFGNAVLSRFPIVATGAVDFPALRTSEQILAGCKQGVICTLQLSKSQQIRILAVHLDDRSEDIRAASAKIIIEAAESSPVPTFAVGDFNSTPRLFPHSQKTTQSENAMDLLIESDQFHAALQTPPQQDDMTFSSTSPAQVIDWILIPGNCFFTDFRTIPSRLSDHRPILADVQLTDECE